MQPTFCFPATHPRGWVYPDGPLFLICTQALPGLAVVLSLGACQITLQLSMSSPTPSPSLNKAVFATLSPPWCPTQCLERVDVNN